MERNENGSPRLSRNSGRGGNVLDRFFRENGASDGVKEQAPNRTEGNAPSENSGTAQPRCRAGGSGINGCGYCENGNTGTDVALDSLPLAYAYIPWQKWRLLYSPEDALKNGTMFEELNKPLGVYGNE